MTAKKTAEKLDAVTLLKSQHREVEALFAKLLATTGRGVKIRNQLFGELALKIEGHAQIEEHNFYPEGRAVDKDMTLEALVEHNAMRDLIAVIKETEPSDETYKAKVTVLKEMIEHHVKEEEQTYFPEVRKALGAEAMHELGITMKQEFDAYIANTAAEHDGSDTTASPKAPVAQEGEGAVQH